MAIKAQSGKLVSLTVPLWQQLPRQISLRKSLLKQPPRGHICSPCSDSKIWDCHTGECLATLQHQHIVRTVAFPPNNRPLLVATGGFEKKLRIFDISQYKTSSKAPSGAPGSAVANASINDGNSNSSESPASPDGITRQVSDAGSSEVGEGVHQGAIKSIIWLPSDTLVTLADDNKIRWFDIRTHSLLKDFALTGTIGSCEMSPDGTVISVAAGKTAYFFSGVEPGQLIKKVETKFDVSCVAYHAEKRQFIVGGSSDTWVRIYDYDTGKELEVNRGHHGPVWTVAVTPDGKMYGTGSEDGTVKLWKFTPDPYGLWK